MHPSLFILSQLNTLRTRNEELAHRNESLTRRVKEKEAELAALSSLQVTSLQKRKSETEESLRTSPPSERSSNTAGSGNGDTLAPLRPGASLRAGNPGPSMTSSWSADGAFVGLRSSTSQRGSIGGPMTKNRLSGSGGTLVRKSFAQRADTRLVAEEVAAAADSLAGESSAPLHVEIDNDADATCTVVRIVAPDRAQLLTDLTSALSGLGLSIERASISTVGTQAINTFLIQEVFVDGARKVQGRQKIASIEQRLRLLFRRRAMQRLLKGGVGAAIAHASPTPSFSSARASSIGSTCSSGGGSGSNPASPTPARSPSLASNFPRGWVHSVAPDFGINAELDKKLIDGLSCALADGWSGTYGALAPSLARKLAANVMSTMSRFSIPEGCSWKHEGEGEWLILLETSAKCTAVPTNRSRHSSEPDHNGSSDLWAPAANSIPEEVDSKSLIELSLPPGSVVWDYAHPAPDKNGEPPETLHRWHQISGGEKVVIRCVARASLRAVMITLREALARSHAALLAELPLFAPLDPTELLSLCRRATEVHFGPHKGIKPVSPAGEGGFARALGPKSLPSDAFCLVIQGNVLIHLDANAAANDANASDAKDVAKDVELAFKAAGLEQLSTSATDDNVAVLPQRIPLARLGFGKVLGENGENGIISPSTITATAGYQGAVLLCWKREASVVADLSRLPLLLPSSWQSRVPLAVLAHVPKLTAILRPLTLPQLHELPSAWRSSPAALTIVLAGELIEVGEVEAHLEPLVSADGQESPKLKSVEAAAAEGELYELKVVLPSRDRLLADLTATLAELKLDVLDGEIATDEKGRAVDTLRIRDRGSSFSVASMTAEDRAASLGERVRTTLQEKLSTTRLRAGDMTMGTVALEEASQFNSSAGSSFHGGARRALSRRDSDTRSLSNSDAGSKADSLDAVIGVDDGILEDDDDEPLVAWIDMRALGALLALEETHLGHMWRAYLRCHMQDLIPPLIPKDRGLTDMKGIGPFITSEGPHTMPQLRRALAEVKVSPTGGIASGWSDALKGVLVHQLREKAGRGDEGLSLDQLQRGPQLGAGACGTVFLAKDVLSDRVYAIKTFVMPKEGDRQKTIMRYLERERDILRLLTGSDRSAKDRRWFVHLVCAGMEGNSLQLVMPACLGGELWNLLNEFGAMTEAEAQFYTACLVLALQRLHSLGIVYRDLKPENVLLREDGWPMIADFGLSSFHVTDKPLYSLCGTPEFMAPEVIGGTGSAGYGPAADWWSLGVLLCQCLTLCTPFCDAQQRPRCTFDNVLRGRLTMPPEQHYKRVASQHAAQMIESLLTSDVGRRLGSPARGEIRAHPFFWMLDWERLEKRQLEPPHVDYCKERARDAKKVFFRQSSPKPMRREGFNPM